MGETAVGIPAVDPTAMLGSAVSSAKNFESLGITGVLFLLVLALGGMLLFKLKNDSKLADISVQISNLTTAINNSVDLNKEMSNSNTKLVEHYLENIKQSIDKLEGYILDIRERSAR